MLMFKKVTIVVLARNSNILGFQALNKLYEQIKETLREKKDSDKLTDIIIEWSNSHKPAIAIYQLKKYIENYIYWFC